VQWLSTRFSLFALAIVVPAVIVAVLGYVSLRQWERSAELLFREQARDVASMAAEKIEMLLRQSDDELPMSRTTSRRRCRSSACSGKRWRWTACGMRRCGESTIA
jgi:hypothetical protein